MSINGQCDRLLCHFARVSRSSDLSLYGRNVDGRLYYQDEDEAGRYTCYYFTGTGDVQTSIKSSTGCKWLITVGGSTEEPGA